MQTTHEGRFRFHRTDIWREGKWLDLWSVVHLLSGASTGFVLYALTFGTKESFATAFVAFVAYEFWEAMVDIVETPANRVLDVVVGMVSFAPTFLFIAPTFTGALFWEVFAAVFVLNVVLAALGWRASQKAAALQARLRERRRLKREERRLRAERRRSKRQYIQ